MGLSRVIVISVDTLRADHLGCYGYPRETSPEIDRLVSESIRFTNAYAMTPLTCPSFATLFTSLPPHKHGAKRNGLAMYQKIRTLAQYLQEAGFTTAAFISNWTLRARLSGLNRGFDHYDEVLDSRRYSGLLHSEGRADRVAEKASAWLRRNPHEKLLLWIHFTDPHSPYTFHEELAVDLGPMPRDAYPPGSAMDKIKRYDTEIRFTDVHVGRLLTCLKDMDLYEDSLIVFHADHGESFGEHRYFRHGRKLYNSCLHVPLAIRLPQGRGGGTTRDENVSLLDIAPTIMSLLHRPIPGTMMGVPLFGILTSPRDLYFETYRGAIFFKKGHAAHLRVHPIRYAIVRDHWKLIYNQRKKRLEAYDLSQDRFETENIYWKHRDELINLTRSLNGYMSKVGDYLKLSHDMFKNPNTLSSEDIEQLRTLGYMD